MPADRGDAACTVAGVRKPSMKEPAARAREFTLGRVLGNVTVNANLNLSVNAERRD
jgi:hypothetical protein